ncbi:3-deoxy-D-manno-octulosonic acid transferase [Bordetella genomosp. 10]|uniref:3-deoxy-D-manno-octulosonic acid transferase n=1 Tax=Bordetella genomosp. 10 TaxID=1416804 RepID=A0A261S5H6_9BORD|nr:3-deoxy-D-manno-octulosonic acid transferase [Bordetella genomosp. 10]OZI32030.1 3-deoxy-D-manno-octulosonic acid transferase [Bordetella genomosp. 10]
MARLAYTLLLWLLAPLIWLGMARRGRKAGGDWGIFSAARFGRYATDPDPNFRAPVWVHAVSLGETRAAQPLVTALLEQGHRILLTHTTATGRTEGARLFAAARTQGQLRQAWLPYDFPGAVRRFLAYHEPRCGVLIEREVWPNLQHEARHKGIPMLLVSARFSASSLRQFRWMRWILQPAYASLSLVLAQTEEDAARLAHAGSLAPRVCGNLKFDVQLDPAQLEQGRAWRRELARPVITISSTRNGEEAQFVEAITPGYRLRSVALAGHALVPDALTVPPEAFYLLIPRHPQRFTEVAAMLDQTGLPFAQRSRPEPAAAAESLIFLGDSLGEMAFYYGASDIAIVAGGFAPLGGQNLIEACAAGLPVIVGPHMFNFAQATQDALQAGAAIQVENAAQALKEAWALLQDEPRRQRMAAAALAWTTAHRGATERILAALRPWLS